MPELPEVETVRRVLHRVLVGQKIAEVDLPEDPILLSKVPASLVRDHLQGQTVTGTGRKGKYFWIELEERPWLFGHLGMTGWIREIGKPTTRLKEHGEAPLDDEEGRPRFLKILLTAADGRKVVMTDGRRLGRLWMGEDPASDSRLAKLGPDCYNETPSAETIAKVLSKKTAPMKAILLDQAIFCGVGNWIADEVLFQSGISPKRLGREVTGEEIEKLLTNLKEILHAAIEAGADENFFPEHWMFHRRWGGSKGEEMIDGRMIVRETVGGRTTAWVPDLQR